MKMIEKEEYAIVLDYLPYGYPLEGKMMPIAQAIGDKHFSLLQLVPRRGITLKLKEKVYIGDGKREQVYYILGKLPIEKITETAKTQLQEFINDVVSEKEKEFIEFFNKADTINKRLHQLNLLPGLGKKFCEEILEEREKKEFDNFEEMKKRLPSLPDLKKAIKKRIFEELTTMQRYSLFVR